MNENELKFIVRDLYKGAPLIERVHAFLRIWNCPFKEMFDLIPVGARLLDVGCGNGLFLGLLAKLNLISSGYGVDVDHRKIKIAQRMAAKNHLPLTFTRQDKTRTPASSFDCVCANDVIHHVRLGEQRDFVKKLGELTSEGKFLVIKEARTRPLWRAIANHVHDLIFARQWVHFVKEDKMKNWLLEDGFNILKFHAPKKVWYSHYIFLAKKGDKSHD